MPSLFARSVAVLAALQATLGLATPISPAENAVEKRAAGFANAVYFTNWYAHLLPLRLLLSGYSRGGEINLNKAAHNKCVTGESMVETTSLPTFRPRRFRMFCTRS